MAVRRGQARDGWHHTTQRCHLGPCERVVQAEVAVHRAHAKQRLATEANCLHRCGRDVYAQALSIRAAPHNDALICAARGDHCAIGSESNARDGFRLELFPAHVVKQLLLVQVATHAQLEQAPER